MDKTKIRGTYMQELIKELKKDLSKEKVQIVDLLLAQIEAYEVQLKKVTNENHVAEQLKLIDAMDKAAA